MLARDIMTEDPVCCTPSTNLRTVAQQMRDNDCGMLPVVDNLNEKRLLGVVTDRDIVCRVVADPSIDCASATAQNAMTTGQLWTVKSDATVDDVIDRMEEGHVRRVTVVDNSIVVGIIALADLALEVNEVEDIAEVLEEVSEPANLPNN